jgi:endonuclease/exonuclease/phosphatase family metal-dependent hydrolase
MLSASGKLFLREAFVNLNRPHYTITISMKTDKSTLQRSLPFALIFAVAAASTASAQTLRIATYNIKADTGSPDSGTGLSTVLEAIGAEHLGGNAQPVDVLALQELYSTPSTTLSYIVNQLNSYYNSPGMYAYDTVVDPTTGGTGGGPSGLIYNTHTVQDIAATVIGTASSSGAPRAPMRYTLQPVGDGTGAQFYLYVSHAKSGTSSSDINRRNYEAGEIRNNAIGLGANAHIIYSGDFNLNDSSESTYKTMIGSGTGQAIDPANPAGNWTDTSAFAGLMTESATNLQYRDDFQFITAPMQNQPGLQLLSGTYTVFGNNGSVPFHGSVTQSTALSDLSNRTAVLNALTTATDHLPVVADYKVVLPSVINWRGGAASSPTNWNISANWNLDIAVPNKAGLAVSFGNQSAASNVANMISQGQSVGSISFDAATSTIISSTGGYSLTLDNNGAVSSIDVAGNQTISALLVLNNDATMTGGGTLSLTGGISGPHTLNVSSGTLIVSNVSLDELAMGATAPIQITADSINVNTLRMTANSTLTIRAIPGGFLASGELMTPVPEPHTWAALILVGMGLCVYLHYCQYSPK